MARKEVVFHDFLGIGGTKGDACELEVTGLKGNKENFDLIEDSEQIASTKASPFNSSQIDENTGPVVVSSLFSSAFQSSDDLSSEYSSHGLVCPAVSQGRKRDSRTSEKRLQMDALDSNRLLKRISQLEKQDEERSGYRDVDMDDLHLTMQPPRLSAKPSNPCNPSTLNRDVVSKKWDTSRSSLNLTGHFGSSKTNRTELRPDLTAISNHREKSSNLQQYLPPADEGSRTGLKNSGVAHLLNSGSGQPASGTTFSRLPAGRSKSWSQNAASEFNLGSKQTTAPSTRQMTIFYGGQAHVFDDVPPDKAEAVMTLAASTGRSWSTVYSQPKGSVQLPSLEGSMPSHNKERNRNGGKGSIYGNLGLPTDIQNVICSSAQGGQRGSHTGPTKPAEANVGQVPRWCRETQTTPAHCADLVGSCSYKEESRGKMFLHASVSADEAGNEPN